jgi:hypothetical protein
MAAEGGGGAAAEELDAGRAFVPEWRKNEAKTFKSGTRGAIYWVKKKAPGKFANGDSYAGDWLHNKKHGFGTQTWSDGGKYQGDWKSGARDGTGTLWVSERGKLRKAYTGLWQRNKPHGTGVFYDEAGSKYEGQFFCGLQEGRGKLVYANGDCYEGEFVGGKRSGLGVLTLANGDQYEGHWFDDVKEGPGRFFYAQTRKVLQAEWVDGSPKCGVFSDWPAGPRGGFSLPALELQQPSEVLDRAFKEARRTRAEKLGGRVAAHESKGEEDEAAQVFSAAELEDIRAAFAVIDTHATGSVAGADLAAVLHELGIYPSAEDMAQLMDTLGASESSRVSLEALVGLLASLRAPQDVE